MMYIIQLCDMAYQSRNIYCFGTLNSMLVSSLKKLSMDNVDIDLWFTGIGDIAKICILVDIPCIMLSYVCTGIPWTYLPGGGKVSQFTLECMNL